WLYGSGFELVRCDGCGHRYSTSVRADAMATKPASRRAAQSELEQAARFDAYLELLGSNLPARARVLDVGSNASELLALFERHGFRAASTQISRPPTSLVPGRRPAAPIWQWRLEDCLPQNECYELVVLSHVLEYLYDPGALLRRLRATLGPEGRVLIEVPNADDRLLSLWRGVYRPLCPGEHVSFFDATHLQQLLRRHGFGLERMIAPTRARDLLYPSVQSAVDAARAVVGRARTRASAPTAPPPSAASVLPKPLRAALDACLSAIDPAVELVCGGETSELRGPVLIAVARANLR
ncbi:MAG: hypothetical protein RL701_1681, partial [Pseudomonadota bacterium]